MKSLNKALTPLALALAPPGAAMEQNAQSGPVLAAGSTVLTVTGEGRTARAPDLAVRAQRRGNQPGPTAGAAMSANAAQMNKVIAALKAADKDVQTSQILAQPGLCRTADRPQWYRPRAAHRRLSGDQHG